MNVLEKVKKEPRIILAVINFVSFFLPWIATEAAVSLEVMGEDLGSAAGVSATGFGLVDYTTAGWLFYLIPLIIIAIPFIKKAEPVSKYLYLILPVVSIILMFSIPLFIKDLASNFEALGVEMNVKRLIGFWIAFACNVVCIGYTLMKDYHVKSKEDLKVNINNINVERITSQVSQVSDAAKEMGSNIQKSLFTTCPNCGNKITKGKKFCSKCGAAVVEETEQKQEAVPKQEVEQKQEAVMRCENCGRELSEDTNFCPGCGKKVVKVKEKICKKCGRKLEEDSKFCPGCGEKAEEE